MYVNCAHCKGIRFIRDQLVLKRNMQNNNGKIFKSIILSNAENLTNDAQSALDDALKHLVIIQDFLLLLKI